MADSNITKRALAAALKELMNETAFEKINVAGICEKCGMNRKSFYYHFKDKYDLVNWIYDTEFISLASQKDYATGWGFLEDLCDYLYENRTFYRRALQIKGQNSFSDHFLELLQPVLLEHLKRIYDTEIDHIDFHVLFFADAFASAIKRWIMEMDNISSEEFTSLLKSIVHKTAEQVYQNMDIL